MKQFGTILKFELKTYLKNKIFLGVTIFLVAAIAAVMFFPRIAEFFHEDPEESADRPIMLVAAEPLFSENAATLQEAFASAFPDYEVQTTEGSPAFIQDQIAGGGAACAFLLKDFTAYTYYVNDLSLYDSNTAVADRILQTLYQINAMTESGIPAQEAAQILSAVISHETVRLGKDQMQNFFYTYVMIFALYMVILLYGQMIATNVATEKSSRAMELLITSAEPAAMMFGKVIASCTAGLIQLFTVFGSAILCFRMNRSYWDGNDIVNSIFNMPLGLLLYMLLFFLLGFLIYAFLYGAIGSTVSKLEDVNTSVMPVTFLFIAAFFVVIFSMASGNVNTTLMRVCSYIPFTSPMAMFTRIAMSGVPAYEIVISVAVLAVSVIGIGILAAKIYRAGVLLYGTTPKIGTVIKAMRKT